MKLLGTSQYRSRTMHLRTYVDTANPRNSIFPHRNHPLARLGSYASKLVRMIQCDVVNRTIVVGIPTGIVRIFFCFSHCFEAVEQDLLLLRCRHIDGEIAN
jgi:hypothetical protein